MVFCEAGDNITVGQITDRISDIIDSNVYDELEPDQEI